LWAGILAKIDAQIALVEPVAMQPFGSAEQRRAFIELAYLKGCRTSCAERLVQATEGLKPTRQRASKVLVELRENRQNMEAK
jgi:hypothetical protein